MSLLWMYLKVFLVGGALCAIGELLVLRTRLTTAPHSGMLHTHGRAAQRRGPVRPACGLCRRGRNRAPHGLRACAVPGGDERRG